MNNKNKFEWDENKRQSNIDKHGIDFEDAIQIFKDRMRVEASSSQKDEERYITFGVVNEVVLAVVYTNRNNVKRIISARVAHENERRIYYFQE
ncbi:hypothetical protein A8135_08030 [Legionella jamestowniensis]|uniref:BrnT family toxin n=1 Tax=Legionella jamestowniensis TaxID=455 RepID=A0ABX2XX95_9GAMM|nr:hypothetical protein A8135_08030 [Legionella jamestowniensis]